MVNTSEQDTDTKEKDGSEGGLSRYVFGSGYPPIGSEEAGNSPYCSAPAELAKNAAGIDPIQPGNYYITDGNGFVNVQATENERARIEAAEQASAALANTFVSMAFGVVAPAVAGKALLGTDGQQQDRPAFLSEAAAIGQNLSAFITGFDANPQEISAPLPTPMLDRGPAIEIA